MTVAAVRLGHGKDGAGEGTFLVRTQSLSHFLVTPKRLKLLIPPWPQNCCSWLQNSEVSVINGGLET